MNRFHIILLTGVLALTGCASHVPLEIRQPPPGDPDVAQARDDIDRHSGARVRWGGSIAAVENRDEETWLEIVASRLDSQGRPVYDDRTPGRFLARMPGFMDPEIYAPGRSVTVYGEVEDSIVGLIGEHEYTYPLIRSFKHQLWPERDDRYARPRAGVHFGFHHGFRSRFGVGFGIHRYHRIPYH